MTDFSVTSLVIGTQYLVNESSITDYKIPLNMNYIQKCKLMTFWGTISRWQYCDLHFKNENISTELLIKDEYMTDRVFINYDTLYKRILKLQTYDIISIDDNVKGLITKSQEENPECWI
jgi:hypothetical protein